MNSEYPSQLRRSGGHPRRGGQGQGWSHGVPGGRKLSSAELQLLILALLEPGAAHGYVLIRRCDARSQGFYVPSPGMIYPALSYLDEIGLVSARADGSRKLYHLTDAGAAQLAQDRATADAILEALQQAGARMDNVREAFEGADAPVSPEVLQARRALRHAVSTTAGRSPEEARRVASILTRAASEILQGAPGAAPHSQGHEPMTTPAPAGQDADPRHVFQRVRHEVRRRSLTVRSVNDLSPSMRRIVLASPELADFTSPAADDHIKLFFDDGAGGTAMRDYTPRSFDQAQGLLTIDFALHEAGPATAWAMAARPGDTLQIGGPRGSVIVPDDFDWYLLVGDETALPAIGRRVEELRAGVPVITVVVVDTPADVQTFETKAAWTGHWIFRGEAGGDDTANLAKALDDLKPASGEGLIWIAAEGLVARALRARALDRHGHPPRWVKASGYWVRGAEGVHENF